MSPWKWGIAPSAVMNNWIVAFFQGCVFTSIPWQFAPQSLITELKELLHQDVTVSAGMEAGHFRSGSTDTPIESKTSEMEGWRDRGRGTIWKADMWRESQTAAKMKWSLFWGFTKLRRGGVWVWRRDISLWSQLLLSTTVTWQENRHDTSFHKL